NVRKHSRATLVEVTLSSNHESLDLMIEDDGPGAASSRSGREEESSPRSWEPAVIRERVVLLKGQLKVEHHPNSGVRLIIRIPTSEGPVWWTPYRGHEPDASRPLSIRLTRNKKSIGTRLLHRWL